MKILLVLSLTFCSWSAFAEDDFEKNIFSGTPQKETETSTSDKLADTLQVGGRLEIRYNTAHTEQQKLMDSGYSQLKRADIYFDTRPTSDLRALLRLRLTEEKPTNNALAAATAAYEQPISTNIDELWFKWDIKDSVFVTVGKQHLKWGSGRMWNPTDFTAVSNRDPLALFDSRLGQELVKVHIPVEKQGYNYYAILQFDSMRRASDLGFALRGEFPFLGTGEAALSFQTRSDEAMRIGADVSSAVGPVDIYLESATMTNEQRTFYTGKIDPDTSTLPTGYDRSDVFLTQIVAGVYYTRKYSDEDNVTVGVEYFHNGLGYEDRELELYSLALQQSAPLYAGRQYLAGYLRLPNPGAWNESSFFLNGLYNLSDETVVARLTATTQIFKDLTLEGFVSQCFGDYGEFCFRMPEKFKPLAADPAFTPVQQQIIGALPTKRTRTTAGISLSMSF